MTNKPKDLIAWRIFLNRLGVLARGEIGDALCGYGEFLWLEQKTFSQELIPKPSNKHPNAHPDTLLRFHAPKPLLADKLVLLNAHA